VAIIFSLRLSRPKLKYSIQKCHKWLPDGYTWTERGVNQRTINISILTFWGIASYIFFVQNNSFTY
jgi:hypothetical protein